MRVSVVSEGRRDIGRKGEGGYKGAVCVLVERLIGEPEWVDVEGWPLVTLHGRGGLEEKISRSIREAHRRKDDGVAVVVDNDGAPPSERRGALRRAAEESGVPIPRALGLAIQEEEAWLLADERAVGEALEMNKSVSEQTDPEKMKDPKQILNELAGKKVRGRDLDRIARVCDLDKVKRRCPKGFDRFAKEVANLFRVIKDGNR